MVVGIAAIIGALQLATPEPAAAIYGLERTSDFSDQSDRPQKIVQAECSDGKYVVGGGGWVTDGGRNRVRLVALMPGHSTQYGDSFTAVAEAPGLSESFTWKLAAYAVCADQRDLDDYSIESASINSKEQFKSTGARCPAGTVAWGAGAYVFGPLGYGSGRLGLQLNRTSGPLDISRATARTDGAYDQNWSLFSSAICARPTLSVRAENTGAPGAEAAHYCTLGHRVHGVGGGGGLADGGPVFLRKLYPTTGLWAVQVELTGLLYPSIGGMVASATCAGG